MKCIHCEADSTYPERQLKRCPRCGKDFAFEPRTGDKLTDMAFHKAIQRVSGDGEVSWGVEHLFYEIARIRRKKYQPVGCVALPVGFLLFGAFANSKSLASLIPVLLAITAGVVISISPRWQREASLSRDEFETLWQRWLKVHGPPKKLIARREIPAPSKELAPDLSQYSFDRVVVCDRARTVDLLLANNFHFENNCAVLGAGGYPSQVFETVRKMLQNNPRLDVYVLHDATPSGCALAHDVAQAPEWFNGKRPVVDVGLRPSHAFPHKGSWEKKFSAIDPTTLGALTAKERAWLAEGWTMELATIRPEQIIKRLYRAISGDRAANNSTDGGSVVLLDTSTLGTDASASDGGGDSFG